MLYFQSPVYSLITARMEVRAIPALPDLPGALPENPEPMEFRVLREVLRDLRAPRVETGPQAAQAPRVETGPQAAQAPQVETGRQAARAPQVETGRQAARDPQAARAQQVETDPRAALDPQAQPVRVEPLELWEAMEFLEMMALQGHRVQQEPPEPKAHEDSLELWEPMEFREMMDLQGHRVQQVPPEPKAHEDSLELWEPMEFREMMALQGPPVLVVLMVVQVPRVPWGVMEFLEMTEAQVQQEVRAPPEVQAQPASRVRLVILALQAHPEALAPQAQEESPM